MEFSNFPQKKQSFSDLLGRILQLTGRLSLSYWWQEVQQHCLLPNSAPTEVYDDDIMQNFLNKWR